MNSGLKTQKVKLTDYDISNTLGTGECHCLTQVLLEESDS